MKTGLLCLFLALATSCSQVDVEAERAILLQINEKQRTAHMTNDAALLVNSMADSVITVDGGNIYRSSRQQVQDRFTAYFKTVKYFKWDDMEAPVIHIAPGGTMATVSVRKEVVAESIEEPRDTTVFAWTSVYRKEGDAWKMYSITSTDAQ